MKPGLGGCYGEKVIFGQKWALRAMLAEDLQNDHFGPQNHVFSITTPKPDNICPHAFLNQPCLKSRDVRSLSLFQRLAHF